MATKYGFVLAYLSFTAFIVIMTAAMGDLEIRNSGLTGEIPVMPDQPNVLDVMGWIFGWIRLYFQLILISTSFKVLAVIYSILTLVMLWVLAEFISGLIPLVGGAN